MDGPDRRSNRGFTLIELLIALVVGSVVLLAVQAVVGQVLDRTTAPQDRDPALQALRGEAVRSALRRWLEGAFVPERPDSIALVGGDFSASGWPVDQLLITTQDRGPLPGPPGAPIRLRLRVAEAGLVVDVSELDRDAPVHTSVLLPEVRGLDVVYLDGTSAPVWLSAWTPQRRLPRAVEVRLLPAPDGQLPAGLRVPVRAVLAGSEPSSGSAADTTTPPDAAPAERGLARSRMERRDR